MKKRITSLIAMGGILCVLLIIYFITINKKEDLEDIAGEDPAIHKFFDRSEKDISSFEIKNDNDFTFIRDGEENSWLLEGHEDFKLNLITVSTLSYSLVGLESKGVIENGDIDSYGLANPTSVVTVNFTDGQKETFLIGKLTLDGKYNYMMQEGNDTVYTIASQTASRFFFGYDDFLDKSLPQLTLTSFYEIGFSINGSEYFFDMGLPYGVEYLGWFREEYIETTIKEMLDMSYAHSALFANLNDLRLTGVVIDAMENLEDYGLKDPALSMNVFDGTNRLQFYVGNATEGGLRYIMLHGDKYVYTAKSEYFTGIESADLSAVFNRRLINVIEKQAETVTIKGVGADRVIHPNSTDQGKADYRKIFELSWDSWIEPEVSGTNSIWGIEIKGHIKSEDINPLQIDNNSGEYESLNDGSIKYSVSLDFYEYNKLFYAVSRDGQPAEVVIAKEKVDRVLSGIK